ncbi:MAG: hypothetical protein KDC38_14085 [Planctomycetes bacterium]|nr:hypothetical protein [Planctomycetota bacterium]
MPRHTCALAIVALTALIPSTLFSQNATLSLTPTQVSPGNVGTTTVRLDTSFDVTAWSYGVCADLSEGEFINALPGPTTLTVNNGAPPAFQDLSFTAALITDSVVVSFVGAAVLPAGDDHQLTLINFVSFVGSGSVGEFCFCDTPLYVTQLTDTSSTSVVPNQVCGAFSPDCASPVVPNRGIEQFDILPRTGEPGHFDLRLTWSVETTTPAIDLGTVVSFEVGGTTVASNFAPAFSGSLSCCDDPTCTPTSCGPWMVGASTEFGVCDVSPLQGVCACRLTRTIEVLDVEIDAGEPVTARLVPTAVALPETIVTDDVVTRLAPYFNREIVRIALVPSAAAPGMLRIFAYWRVTSDEVDGPVDYSMDILAEVMGSTAAPAQGEVEVRLPDGVDSCLTLNCHNVCKVLNSGAKGTCEVQGCTMCAAADIIELGLTAAPPAGTGIEISSIATIAALPETDPVDDIVSVSYSGPIFAANRSILSVSHSPGSAPGTIDIDLTWRAETGGAFPEDLSSSFQILVGTTEVATFESAEVIGGVASPCVAPNCDGLPCGTWTVGGIPAVGTCDYSDEQLGCVCGTVISESFEGIDASSGDTVTVRLRPDVGTFPEGLVAANSIQFVVGTDLVRGDTNADGNIDLADAIHLLTYLFQSGPLGCRDAGDIDDSAALDIADPIGLLTYLLQGGAPPPAPFPGCGPDTTPDALDCLSFPGCP